MAGAKRYLSRVAVNTSDDGSSAIQLIAPVRMVVSAPANVSGSAHLYGKTVSGRALLHMRAGAGRETPVSPAVRNRHVGLWQWFNSVSVVSGVSGVAASGSAYNHQPGQTGVTGSLSAAVAWLGQYTATSTGSSSSLVLNGNQFVTGDGSGGYGFSLAMRGGHVVQTPTTGLRCFIGLSVSYNTGTANTDPSALTNVVGIGVLATDSTQWYVVYGGTTAQAPMPTGVPIYAGSSYSWDNGQLVDLHVHCSPDEVATYHMRVETADGTTSFETTVSGGSAVVPQATSNMYALAWANNNTYSASSMVFLSKIYYSKVA